MLADLFLYSYENEFLDNMIRNGHRKLARSFNLCYRHTDDLIFFNNKKFGDYVEEIYTSQLTFEKANTSVDIANYLDLNSIIGSRNQLNTKPYDKRDFDFHIGHFPFLPYGLSYDVYIYNYFIIFDKWMGNSKHHMFEIRLWTILIGSAGMTALC